MKSLIKIFLIMVVSTLPLSMVAQDNFDELDAIYNEYSRLKQRAKDLNDSIKIEEENSYNLRLTWYYTCKSYLQKQQFKAEELQSLIAQTFPEIDGDELYDELMRAKECFDGGNEYQYKDIPEPTRNSVVTPMVSSDNKPKKNSKKKVGNKKADKNNKKNDKKTPPSNDKKENTVVDNDADKKDTTPKQEKPIVTDPSKDRNGEDKPSAPVVKKDSDKEDETKPDKGEIEDGKSKKSENNGGSK